MAGSVEHAVDVIRNGGLVVYPTETVYGIGANALDVDAIESVYKAKIRPANRPLSIAFPNIESALKYVRPSPEEISFMNQMLPGPITILLEKREKLPDRLAGRGNRIGIRIPDHDVARKLLDGYSPITATSANVSGQPNARRAPEVPERIRRAAGVILDGGETMGGESTVVNVAEGRILRTGRGSDKVEEWIRKSCNHRGV